MLNNLPWLESPASPFSQELRTSIWTNELKELVKPIKIGNVLLPNNLVLAPMAGVTDGSFRLLCSRLGVGFIVSELASAKAISVDSIQTRRMIEFQGETRPYAVQIFGSNPDLMAEAAKRVEAMNVCDIIDINMGCPVPKVVKTGAGSALMKTPDLAAQIVKKVKAAVSLPVTTKCRIGWSETTINVKDFVKTLLDSGSDAITIHARTRQAGYAGTAQWEHLVGIKEICQKVPFIANGDISSIQHLKTLKEMTDCDGFMLGRGIVGRPWIFTELLGHPGTDSPEFQYKVFRHHLLDMLMEMGPKAVPLFRVHLFGYLRNHPGAARLRRDLCEERDPQKVLEVGKEFFLNSELE